MRSAFTAIAVLTLAGAAYAQSAGSIAGTVKDSSGAALPGATVTLVNESIGVNQVTTTDARGAFVSLQLPPGTYTVTVEMSGFKKAAKAGVILPTGSNFDRTHYFVANYVWNLPKGGRLLGGGRLARALLDDWTLSGITWIASGNPIELGVNIAGVNAAQRLLGTDSGGNAGGLQPRLRVTGDPAAGSGPGRIDPSALVVPGINDRGPYDRYYLRNPGFTNFDLSVFKNVPFGGNGKRYLQLRVEAFNVFNSAEFDQLNTATNVVNAAGQTGAAVFNNYTGLTVTNNLRPAGDTRVLGTFFGEPNRTRDPRIVQLGIKLYF